MINGFIADKNSLLKKNVASNIIRIVGTIIIIPSKKEPIIIKKKIFKLKSSFTKNPLF